METSVDSPQQPQLPEAEPSPRSLYGNMFRGSSVYALAVVAPILASMLLSPITTRCLTQSEFGVSDLLSNISYVLSALFSVNLSASLGYFYFASTTEAGRRKASGTAILGSAVLGTLAMVAAWPFATLISQKAIPGVDAAPYVRLIIILLPASFTMDALFAWLRVENRSILFTAGAVMRVLLTIGGTLLFVWALHLHIWGVLITSACAIVLAMVWALSAWLRRMKPVLDFHLFASMTRFSLPLMTGSLAMFFLNFGDRFFLAHYRPMEDVAVYSIAYKIGMVISAAYGAFAIYWNSQVFPIMRRSDSADVFRRVSTYMLLLVSLVGLCLVVFSPPLVRIMYRWNYWEAAALVPIIVLAYVLRSIGDFVRCLFLVEGRPVYDAICTFLGAGICLGGYVWLIPKYGMWGAAVATAIAFGAMALISLAWTYRMRPYSLDGRRLTKILLALAAGLALHWLAPAADKYTQLARGVGSLTLFLSLLWILRFPTAGEWRIVRSVASRCAQQVRATVLRWRAILLPAR